jgi:glycosyltransferase involved in cell wall biosynthesis
MTPVSAPRALWMSHTADKGGAELFLIDVLRDAPAAWSACFLADGPAAETLTGLGRKVHVVTAGEGMLRVTRDASAWRVLSSVRGLIQVAVKLAGVMKDYDVLFANSQKSLFVASLAGLMSGKPVVWVLHDILTDEAFSGINRRAAVFFSNHFARAVVANSKATADALIVAGGRPRALSTVYNGFDVTAIASHRPEDIRSEFGFDARPVAGLFSRLSAWKGQHVLLRALVKCPDMQALIVGGALFGQEAYEAELREMVLSLGLEDRVRFAGFRNDIARLMASVDIVLHTSTHPEPFGRVVVEGMLARRPVIATDAGGVAEIIDSGKTGLLVPPDDVEALGHALNQLTEDRGLAAELAEAGFASAAARYDLAVSRRQLVDLSHQVAGKAR